MSVLCLLLPPWSRCSRYLLHCLLRFLPHSPGCCPVSCPLTRLTPSPGFRCSRSGWAAACQASAVAAASVAPGWSHSRCHSRKSLPRRGWTWPQPDRTGQQVSGQMRESVSYGCCHWDQRSPLWSLQKETRSSWRQMRPNLSDRCRRRSRCQWDWLMWRTPETVNSGAINEPRFKIKYKKCPFQSSAQIFGSISNHLK